MILEDVKMINERWG